MRYGRRLPSNFLIATVKLVKIQAEVKSITKGRFDFRNIRKSIRVVTREMADYSAIMRTFMHENCLIVLFTRNP